MSKGWRLVSRLGAAGTRYPHVLVDSHGWCLRLGANTRQDEKYYSSFPNLLQGMVEHFARRRLAATAPLSSLMELVGEVKDAMRTALDLCREAVEEGGLHEHMRRAEGLGKPSVAEHTPFPARAVPGRTVPSGTRTIRPAV
ncbi:MAG TPA: hypothetical protein VF950_08715 [Planctomycetota bacterium]